MESIKEQGAFTAFERLFKERGLPLAIRSDNGVPFASPNGLFNPSRLAVWWLRLGITIERIQPGHPQQNGRHERMHRTLKMEATRPAGCNFLQQQAMFDVFVHEFNHERPHEALEMKCPVEVYKPSTRPYQGIGELSYPLEGIDALSKLSLRYANQKDATHRSEGIKFIIVASPARPVTELNAGIHAREKIVKLSRAATLKKTSNAARTYLAIRIPIISAKHDRTPTTPIQITTQERGYIVPISM